MVVTQRRFKLYKDSTVRILLELNLFKTDFSLDKTTVGTTIFQIRCVFPARSDMVGKCRTNIKFCWLMGSDTWVVNFCAGCY